MGISRQAPQFSSPSLWKRSVTLLHFGTPGRLLPSADASIEVSLLNTQSFLEAAGQAESTEGGEYFTPVCIYKIFLQVTGSELASSRQGIQVCQHLKMEPQGALMLPWDKKWGKKINISLAPDCLLSFLPPHCKHFSLNRLYLLIYFLMGKL